MSEEFDITTLIEGMPAEEGMEYLRAMLNPETKAQFLAKRRDTKLRERYEAEIAKVPMNGSQFMKIKTIDRIKEKYRRQGLEVW